MRKIKKIPLNNKSLIVFNTECCFHGTEEAVFYPRLEPGTEIIKKVKDKWGPHGYRSAKGTSWGQCFDASVIDDQKETKDNEIFRFVEDTRSTDSSLG